MLSNRAIEVLAYKASHTEEPGRQPKTGRLQPIDEAIKLQLIPHSTEHGLKLQVILIANQII